MLSAFAQQDVEMADTFRADGKIYVVVAVLVTILLGLFGYLVVTDRKVSQLENEMKSIQED
jgi:CcmD family protein